MNRHGRPSWREQVYELLDREKGQVSAEELALRIGCSRSSAVSYRRAWVTRQESKDYGGECERCGVLGWERNLVIKGRCLWCRAQESGLDVRALCESGEWDGILEEARAMLKGGSDKSYTRK